MVIKMMFLLVSIKSLKDQKDLSRWRKESFGDVYKQFLIQEEIVRLKEELFEKNPNIENTMVFQIVQAELKWYIHFEEEFWKKKMGSNGFLKVKRI